MPLNKETKSNQTINIALSRIKIKSKTKLLLSSSNTTQHVVLKLLYPIYPTPPLGQDMTQGQILNGV